MCGQLGGDYEYHLHFAAHGLAFDYILNTNYEQQVEAQLAGQIHVAWNSPLAWLETERNAALRRRRAEAICMRDTDRDLTSVVITRKDSLVRSLADLKGRRVIPLYFLAEQGLEPNREFDVIEFDVLAGKHGIRQTPAYDHYNFTVLDDAPAEAVARFGNLLLEMSYADPQVRRLLRPGKIEAVVTGPDGRIFASCQGG